MNVHLYAFIAFFFLALQVHSSIHFSSAPRTKQVIVHSYNYGDGWGDPSSALYIAMRFKKLGFRVYVVIERNLEMKNEISDYFNIFGPSLESFYGLTRGDIYFYTEKLACDFESAWKERLFSPEQLFRFFPNPSENPGIVYCPWHSSSKEIDEHFSNLTKIEFDEFGKKHFPP